MHRKACGTTDFFKVSFHVVDSFLEFRITQRDEIWAKAAFIFSNSHPKALKFTTYRTAEPYCWCKAFCVMSGRPQATSIARQRFVNLAANGPGKPLNGEQKHCQRIYDTATKPEPATSAKSSAATVMSIPLAHFYLVTQRRSVRRTGGTNSYIVAGDPAAALCSYAVVDPNATVHLPNIQRPTYALHCKLRRCKLSAENACSCTIYCGTETQSGANTRSTDFTISKPNSCRSTSRMYSESTVDGSS